MRKEDTSFSKNLTNQQMIKNGGEIKWGKA